MRGPFARDVEFRRLLEGSTEVDLARVALEVARDFAPDLDVDAYLGRIDALADRVRERSEALSPRGRIAQVNWVLFVEEAFRGDVDRYDDPRNSRLDEVIDRRLGIPITLAIVYQAVARRAGLATGGINFPAHYLLRVLEPGEPMLFVDPFHAGRVLDWRACGRFLRDLTGDEAELDDAVAEPCSPTVTASRLLRNLKILFANRRDVASALPVVRRLGSLNPADATEQRDWGLLALRADRPGEAVAPLTRYVDLSPPGPARDRAREWQRLALREAAARN